MEKIVIKALASYSIVFTILTGVIVLGDPNGDPNGKGIMIMALLLISTWCAIGGTIMYKERNRFKSFFRKIPLNWQVKFVLFATLFALLEESITVSLTNIVPRVLGLPMDIVHVTASSNYFHTVLGHSVIIFVGFFLAWSWLLKRYAFKLFEVFLLFGFVGSIGEVMISGPQTILAGFWFFVYGLMIYLPVYSIPDDRGVPRPRWYHYSLTIILPLLMTIPMGLLSLVYRGFFEGAYFPGVI